MNRLSSDSLERGDKEADLNLCFEDILGVGYQYSIPLLEATKFMAWRSASTGKSEHFPNKSMM